MESKSPVRPLWRVIRVVLMFVLVAAIVLVAWPSPIDPVSYEPPAPPALAENELLRSTVLIGKGSVQGPEDVDVDDQGRVYGGTADGRVVRILADGKVETFATTGGRPLGMDFDKTGNLIVCDADKGLLSISPKGEIAVLATEAEGVPFRFTDDCEIGGDGVIYFSDASDRFGEEEYMLDLLEGRPHGRLLAYDPATKQTKVLLRDLYFANGVAVGPDDAYVLVNETYRYRITRYWLKGPKAGNGETFAENLPGFPDGVSSSPRGTFWVAMFTVRNPVADRLAPRPWLRKQMAKLPSAFWPKPAAYGLVLEMDGNGKLLRSLQDPGGKTVSNITSVHEENGWLYFGTLTQDYAAKWKNPDQASVDSGQRPAEQKTRE